MGQTKKSGVFGTSLVVTGLVFVGLGGYAIFHFYKNKAATGIEGTQSNTEGSYRTGSTQEVPVLSPQKVVEAARDTVVHSVPKAVHEPAPEPASVPVIAERHPASSSSDSEEESDGGSAAPSEIAGGAGNLRDCARIEYLGPGTKRTEIKNSDWAEVMRVFHESKDLLLVWFKRNRANMSSQTAKELERIARQVRIQRPPAVDEPDLAWRGVGVWSADNLGSVIRVGGGFIELMKKNKKRARFELVRLIAQGWAPCELKKQNVSPSPWASLTTCLGLEAQEQCEAGSYSDAGWAVSTALAANVANPGCVIPAFAESDASKCVLHIPLSVMASSHEASHAGGQP